ASAPVSELALAGRGHVVAFVTMAAMGTPCAGGGNNLFLHDREAGLTLWVAADLVGGDPPSPALSPDGPGVAFRQTLAAGARRRASRPSSMTACRGRRRW